MATHRQSLSKHWSNKSNENKYLHSRTSNSNNNNGSARAILTRTECVNRQRSFRFSFRWRRVGNFFLFNFPSLRVKFFFFHSLIRTISLTLAGVFIYLSFRFFIFLISNPPSTYTVYDSGLFKRSTIIVKIETSCIITSLSIRGELKTNWRRRRESVMSEDLEDCRTLDNAKHREQSKQHSEHLRTHNKKLKTPLRCSPTNKCDCYVLLIKLIRRMMFQ